MRTIPGVGPALAATFTAEIGDIWRFDDFDQLAAYAGVRPKEQSSGTKCLNPETSWHLAKTGNAYLRPAACRMAVVWIQHHPIIRADYLRQRAGQERDERGRPLHVQSPRGGLEIWSSGQALDPTNGAPKT